METAEQYYLKALDAYEKHDYASALQLFIEATNLGHELAVYMLGVMHYNGQGVKQDVDKSIRYFEYVAKRGNPDAMFNLGIILEKQKGNSSEALAWYQKAADLGQADALKKLPKQPPKKFSPTEIRELVRSGFKAETENDYHTAIRFYKQAGEAGHADALYSTGLMYRKIDDNARAYFYFREAALKGDLEAMNDFIIAGIAHGRLPEPNSFSFLSPDEHLDFFKESFVEIDSLVHDESVRWLFEGAIAVDDEIKTSQLAADFNYCRAITLASMYSLGIGTTEDKKATVSIHSRVYKNLLKILNAKDTSHLDNKIVANAYLMGGYIFFNGYGVEKNDKYARDLWSISGELLNNPDAMCYLGQYFSGSLAEKRKWYSKAAELGLSKAMRALKEWDDEKAQFEKNLRLAKQGDYVAICELAKSYDRGIGVERDSSLVAKLLLKAEPICYRHEKNLQINSIDEIDNIPLLYDSIALSLGHAYYRGNGVEQDYYEAFRWYSKAADIGNYDAMLALSKMYAEGKGTDKRPSLADNAKKLADEISGGLAGVVKDEYFLGRKLWLGEFGEKAFLRAIKHFKRIIDKEKLTDSELEYKYAALDTIVRMYEEGEGFRKNKQKAKEFRAEAEKYRKYYKGCFITTAVCDSLGKSDDCYELTTFRHFRDNWLIHNPEGKLLIEQYYRIAPTIVWNINSSDKATDIYRSIWQQYLEPCLRFIENKDFASCKNLYVTMVSELQKTYLH